jgi:hypothetical protein
MLHAESAVNACASDHAESVLLKKTSVLLGWTCVLHVQGQGYHCVGKVCQKQCSVGGKQCRRTADLNLRSKDTCQDIFAHDTHICVAPGSDVAEQLQDDVISAMRALTPVQASVSRKCLHAIERLACFRVARECSFGTDVELPLCLGLCLQYKKDCNISESEETCATAGPLQKYIYRCSP